MYTQIPKKKKKKIKVLPYQENISKSMSMGSFIKYIVFKKSEQLREVNCIFCILFQKCEKAIQERSVLNFSNWNYILNIKMLGPLCMIKAKLAYMWHIKNDLFLKMNFKKSRLLL